LTIATVFPLLEIPKANPTNITTGIKYASRPNMPNNTLLNPVAAVPLISPTTHKNAKIETAKIIINITSFFTAISTLFLVFFLVDFLGCLLAVELLVLLDLDLVVLVRLRDALLPDADAILSFPQLKLFRNIITFFGQLVT
jgi:hypothetical protein